jgi:exoribonuclease-2
MQPSLAALAEQAMIERGFVPLPPAEAMAEAARAELGLDERASDLRGLPWSSIDNPESRDLDQIEVIERCGDGMRLLVGIADVDRFARVGSAIDGHAAHNGVTVYTGVRTYPMVPERLSFDLSSLLGAQDRAAVVIESVVGRDGALASSRILAARVKNHARLDYPSVSAWLDGKGPAPKALITKELMQQVELQEELASLLRDARRRAGALDVDMAETRPVIGPDGQVVGMAPRQQDRAGRIVEDLMILSNRSAACALDRAGIPSIRRIVREPARWERLVEFAAEHGGQLGPKPDARALSSFMDHVRATRPEQLPEISLSVVKLMGPGEYVAHAPGEAELGHFGLATSQYTHATAPNRRYIDLAIQRLLLAAAGGGRSPYGLEELGRIATHAGEREGAAKKVERSVHKSAVAMLIGRRVGDVFPAVVTGASPKGTFVRVREPPVEGKLVAGERGLEVGDRLRVRLRSVDVARGFIDFEAT